ncbi:hypothetical protein MASR1M12_38710 [Erysipelotrichia bacterium]
MHRFKFEQFRLQQAQAVDLVRGCTLPVCRSARQKLGNNVSFIRCFPKDGAAKTNKPDQH